MSASGAAPLPRLGEVFFDVRGESRSMRLSWYADTGVAVFSIWQGSTCTGTFRLPITDLPRMVATLQKGPAREHRQARDGQDAGDYGQCGAEPAGQHRGGLLRPAIDGPEYPEYPGSADRWENGASPDSFPYGPPPVGRPVPGRGR